MTEMSPEMLDTGGSGASIIHQPSSREKLLFQEETILDQNL
jgi:hypothetical protein